MDPTTEVFLAKCKAFGYTKVSVGPGWVTATWPEWVETPEGPDGFYGVTNALEAAGQCRGGGHGTGNNGHTHQKEWYGFPGDLGVWELVDGVWNRTTVWQDPE